MFTTLLEFTRRPAPFSKSTIKDLWTRPHLASRMLSYHLDQATPLASRPIAEIEEIVTWLDQQLSLKGARLCDLGCGPGLYSTRFAARGARVTGVDFSPNSIDYARSQAVGKGWDLTYLNLDYTEDPLPSGFDLVTLIYYDLCALSPTRRQALLTAIRKMLNQGGKLILDVVGLGSLTGQEESSQVQANLMQGFWAPGDYIGLHRHLLYPQEALSLDHYLIVEPKETWEVYNWMQYFTPEHLLQELQAAGFQVDSLTESLTGTPLTENPSFLSVIAS